MSEDPYSEETEVWPAAVFDYFGSAYYSAGTAYWSAQPATLSGMLAGHVRLHERDIRWSESILARYFAPGASASCENVACGIGRCSVSLLCRYFGRITFVEPVGSFLARAAAALGERGVEVGTRECGAQDWEIDEDFDCFWLQWVLLFLTDDDCVRFLRRYKGRLKPRGMIFVKENLTDADHALWSPEDHSLSRRREQLAELIAMAELVVGFEGEQLDWDRTMLPLYCYVLKTEVVA
jgi:protein N-terminal methyltransferase